MKRYLTSSMLALSAFAAGCAASADIHMQKQADGVWIMENERKVFFYRTDGSTGPAKRAGRNHYIHPLMALDGSTELTLDAPSDHLHHRGIFWGWSEIFAGGEKVAYGWKLQDIRWQVNSVTFDQQSDTLDINVDWLAGKPEQAIIAENLRIAISETVNGEQSLTFNVNLTALVDGVSIAGVQNTKQYGGFSVRLENTRDIRFSNDGNKVKPTKDLLQAGNSIDIKYPNATGLPDINISCAANNQPINKWILRNGKSMQNCVWPGREHAQLIKGEVTSLQASITLSQP